MTLYKIICRTLLSIGLISPPVWPLSAMAQSASPAPASPASGTPAADPAQEAAKRAFESLPEADRIAIQDGLIWTGDYKGVPDGRFGKGTREAIAAFAARSKFATDGTLDAKGRTALALAAKQAKDAVHFLVQTDEKTGVSIGVPLKLLPKTKPLANGTRYSSADESFWLEISTRLGASSSLQDVFTAMTADAPSRKITYKVIRPDFFVITGEQDGSAFYTRFARGERAGSPALNGFTVTYPVSARLKFDPISIAIANSFRPFSTVVPASAAPTSAASSVAASPAASAAPPDNTPPKPALQASGVIIAPGLVLTSLPKSCDAPQAGSKPAKIVRQSESDGLTLLALDASGGGLPLRSSDPQAPAPIIVLSYVAHPPARDELTGAAGEFHKAEAPGAWRVLAAVQNPVAGSAVLDRSGALAGLIPVTAKLGRSVGGVIPEMNRDVIPASKINAFLAEARPKTAERLDVHTTGEIVALGRAAMVAIYCAH